MENMGGYCDAAFVFVVGRPSKSSLCIIIDVIVITTWQPIAQHSTHQTIKDAYKIVLDMRQRISRHFMRILTLTRKCLAYRAHWVRFDAYTAAVDVLFMRRMRSGCISGSTKTDTDSSCQGALSNNQSKLRRTA